ncbi:Mitogen-activated protein kinase kinase kinase 9 [Camellia lanceoleosa]|nr:Mitogen-activated protein kinase kinase kinase 9 [Camellia lanceoleosa]
MDNPITAKTSRSCGGGIEGVRAPVLAPPPSISLPRMDNSCSTWDILKSFAPDFNIDLSSAREYSSSDDDEEIVEQKFMLEETAVLSKSSSFTTTNDDDCWSLATEMSNISPNDRLSSISLNDRFPSLGTG